MLLGQFCPSFEFFEYNSCFCSTFCHFCHTSVTCLLTYNNSIFHDACRMTFFHPSPLELLFLSFFEKEIKNHHFLTFQPREKLLELTLTFPRFKYRNSVGSDDDVFDPKNQGSRNLLAGKQFPTYS